MKTAVLRRMSSLLMFGLVFVSDALAATKPLLAIQVETEKANVTQPGSVRQLSPSEVELVRRQLTNELGGMFTIVPANDKRDCFDLSVVLEHIDGQGGEYVGSSAFSMARGKYDILVTHNPLVEPSLEKIVSAITFQMSSIQLNALLGH